MLVDYGSGSESGSEDEKPIVTPKAAPASSTPTTAVNSSTFPRLPHPKASSTSENARSAPSLPIPKPRRRDGPVKITLTAPKRAPEDDEADTLLPRPTKRAKLEGAGSSSLMSMLPAPSSKAPLPPPKRGNRSAKAAFEPKSALDELLAFKNKQKEDPVMTETKATAFMPPSLITSKARTEEKPAEPAVDFFSISKPNRPKSFVYNSINPWRSDAAPVAEPKLPASSSTVNNPSSITITAAPNVEEFIPPDPTPSDPYPGYFKMPNGKWAAYDPEYYSSIARTWVQQTTEEMGRSRQRDINTGDDDHLREVSAMDEASRTRAEIEARKDLTADVIRSGPKAPNMKVTVRSSFLRLHADRAWNLTYPLGGTDVRNCKAETPTVYPAHGCIHTSRRDRG
jgi:proline-rich protein PRCC